MPAVSTAKVFERFLPAYRSAHRISPQQARVLNYVASCRTAVMGGQHRVCRDCGYEQELYYSCRNRHCPQCQQGATEAWLSRRREDLLPVPYFHLVFTLPHELNGWVQQHPEVMYRLLFQAVSSTLKAFGQDPRRLDGELGMMLILHTWGQNLSQHVHMHCLVPAGALSNDGRQWHAARSSYLFPVRALSRRYRGRMVSLLREAWQQDQLHRITEVGQVESMLDRMMCKSWVVYAKATSTHTDTVLNYLSRYTYRIAINDHRLVEMDTETVAFRWKNYRSGRKEVMRLTGEEFVRRWLLHVLPKGFMRIRHYGFLANCHRRAKLARIRACLACAAEQRELEPELVGATKPVPPSPCPRCGSEAQWWVSDIEPRRRRCLH